MRQRSRYVLAIVAVAAVVTVAILGWRYAIAILDESASYPVGTPSPTSGHQAAAPRGGLRTVPEYRRRMQRVVLSVADDDTTFEHHRQILSRLPDYTEVTLLAPRGRMQDIGEWIDRQADAARIRLVIYDPQRRQGARLYLLMPDNDQLVAVDAKGYTVGGQYGTAWAQDLFEVAVDADGRTVLLTARGYKCFVGLSEQDNRRVQADNLYLDCLAGEHTEVRRTPLAFKGGNLLIDEIDNRRVAFCGADSIRTTRTAWRAFDGGELSDGQVVEMLRQALAVDDAVLLGGGESQPVVMYHLDQAMLLLGDRVAAVPRLLGEVPPLEPDAGRIRHVMRFLAEVRSTLAGLGYRLVDVDTTVADVLDYRHHTNAVAYIDRHTQQRTLLMPVYPGNDSADGRRLVEKNIAAFESVGYTVVEVPTTANELYGGIHCMLNVLQ